MCLNAWSLFDSSCFETMQPMGGGVLVKKVSFWVGRKFYSPDASLSTICVLPLKSKERSPSHTILHHGATCYHAILSMMDCIPLNCEPK